MLYGEGKATVLLGELNPGATATIKVIDTVSDSILQLQSNQCVESTHSLGTFRFNTSNILSPTREMFYVMTDNSGRSFKGKFLFDSNLNKDEKEALLALEEDNLRNKQEIQNTIEDNS